MATVITNLFSAIPFIGTDIVQFIYGLFRINNESILLCFLPIITKKIINKDILKKFFKFVFIILIFLLFFIYILDPIYCDGDEIKKETINFLDKKIIQFGPDKSPFFSLSGAELLKCISTGTILTASYAISKKFSKNLIELNNEEILKIFENNSNKHLNKKKILGNTKLALTVGSTTLITSWTLVMQSMVEGKINLKKLNTNSFPKNLDYHIENQKVVWNKILEKCQNTNFENQKCKFISDIIKQEEIIEIVKSDVVANSPLEFLYHINDPYLTILVCAFISILAGLYLLNVVIINLKYPDLFLIKSKFKNKLLLAYFDFIHFIRGPILNIIIIMTYLLFISALIFLYYLIYYYPPC